MNRSIDFFARQFERQIACGDYALNPFERRALPYVGGEVVDLGCGLGNLAIAAARRGARVTAIDACPHAVADLARRALQAGVSIETRAQDLAGWRADRRYDTVVSIGLLMFLPCDRAWALLDELRRATAPSGVLVLNILVEGTTYGEMFDGDRHCLLPVGALRQRFDGWQLLEECVEEFPVGARVKRFVTLVARRPAAHVPAP